MTEREELEEAASRALRKLDGRGGLWAVFEAAMSVLDNEGLQRLLEAAEDALALLPPKWWQEEDQGGAK